MATFTHSPSAPTNYRGPVTPDVLAARQRACPNYTPFTIGGTYGGTIIPAKENIQFVTLDVPHGKRGSGVVRGWAKFLGARFESKTKEWRVAGENLLDTFTSGQTVLDGLNSMRLITGWKPYTPAYVARNLGVRTIWANPPFSKRALVKAFVGARWDAFERAWSIPVSENDQAFSQQLSVLERMGWVDTVKSEAPLMGVASMTPAAIVPVDANQAAAMVFVPAASSSPRRSTRQRFQPADPLVTPNFSPSINWFDPHIKASTPSVEGSQCSGERLWLGGLLDLYHTGPVSDTAVQHVFLRPPASTPREHSDYAAAFEFFANPGVSTQSAEVVRVGFYLPQDSAPLVALGSTTKTSCRIGWNWAYLPRDVARSIWDNMTRHYGWAKCESISRTLTVGETMGWVVLGNKEWPTNPDHAIAVRESLIIRAGRAGSPNPDGFAFPMNRNSEVWEALVRRFGGSQI